MIQQHGEVVCALCVGGALVPPKDDATHVPLCCNCLVDVEPEGPSVRLNIQGEPPT